MQDKYLTLLSSKPGKRLVHVFGLFVGERGLFRFIEVFHVDLLGALARVVSTDAIDRNSMRDRIQPRPQRSRIL